MNKTNATEAIRVMLFALFFILLNAVPKKCIADVETEVAEHNGVFAIYHEKDIVELDLFLNCCKSDSIFLIVKKKHLNDVIWTLELYEFQYIALDAVSSKKVQEDLRGLNTVSLSTNLQFTKDSLEDSDIAKSLTTLHAPFSVFENFDRILELPNLYRLELSCLSNGLGTSAVEKRLAILKQIPSLSFFLCMD